MVDKDKPTVHFSAAALARETKADVEPFAYMAAGNKLVTFPNFYREGPAREAEEKLRRWQSGNTLIDDIAKEWLSEKDYKILDGEGYNLEQLAIIVEHAISYYEKAAGSLGEGVGSGN